MDNVVRNGHVADPNCTGNGIVDGVRNLLKGIKGDKEVDAVTMGLAGEKGYDGFLFAVKK